MATEEERTSLPLFIKLDRYKDVIQQIESVEKVLSYLKELFSYLKELESMMAEVLMELETRVSKLESEIRQPGKVLKSASPKELKDIEELMEGLRGIKTKIEKI